MYMMRNTVMRWPVIPMVNSMMATTQIQYLVRNPLTIWPVFCTNWLVLVWDSPPMAETFSSVSCAYSIPHTKHVKRPHSCSHVIPLNKHLCNLWSDLDYFNEYKKQTQLCEPMYSKLHFNWVLALSDNNLFLKTTVYILKINCLLLFIYCSALSKWQYNGKWYNPLYLGSGQLSKYW